MKGSTHYGNMFSDQKLLNQDSSDPLDGINILDQQNNNTVMMHVNYKNIPIRVTNKSRVRISTESMKSNIQK